MAMPSADLASCATPRSQPAAITPPEGLGEHLPVLDGIRGLAILAVMIFHQTIMTSETLVDHLFLRVAQFGWCGVDLFFVLSGFLITRILLDAKGMPHYLRNFYARRVLRIFPVYFAVLIFCVGVLPLIPHPKAANFGRIAGDEVWYFVYLQNYVMAWRGAFRHGILDVTWSLAIEEQFYLAWPFVVLLLSPRGILRVCLMGAGASLTLRLIALALGASPIAVYVATPLRLDGLLAGAFAAVAVAQPATLGRLLPTCRVLALVTGLAVLGVWLGPAGESWETPLTATVGFSLLAVFFAAALLLAVGAAPGGLGYRLLTLAVLRAFGKYSYAMYLFHLPLRALLRDTVFGSDSFPTLGGSPLPGQLLFYVAATLLTFLIAWLSWHLLEKQVLKLKGHFPRDGHMPIGSSPARTSTTGPFARNW
jgi:peptidoglycan/LPS O-acetylase OafA/YrhL